MDRVGQNGIQRACAHKQSPRRGHWRSRPLYGRCATEPPFDFSAPWDPPARLMPLEPSDPSAPFLTSSRDGATARRCDTRTPPAAPRVPSRSLADPIVRQCRIFAYSYQECNRDGRSPSRAGVAIACGITPRIGSNPVRLAGFARQPVQETAWHVSCSKRRFRKSAEVVEDPSVASGRSKRESALGRRGRFAPSSPRPATRSP